MVWLFVPKLMFVLIRTKIYDLYKWQSMDAFLFIMRIYTFSLYTNIYERKIPYRENMVKVL